MVLGAPAETLLAKSIPPEVWNSSQICAPYDIETRAANFGVRGWHVGRWQPQGAGPERTHALRDFSY